MSYFVEQIHAYKPHIYFSIFSAKLKVTVIFQKLHPANDPSRLCSCVTPASASTLRRSSCTSLCLLIRRLAIGCRAHVDNSGWSHLEICNYFCKVSFFQIKLHLQVLNVNTWTYPFEGHHSSYYRWMGLRQREIDKDSLTQLQADS